MRTKTLAPSKKTSRAVATKKTLSAPKKRPAVASPKKRTPSPKAAKPASLAKQKLELHRQVRDFVTAAFEDRRMAYFVSPDERKEGAYVMCFAVEGESGFYKADWGWHCGLARARAETALMNKKLGLKEEEVNKIIISTMGPEKRRKK